MGDAIPGPEGRFPLLVKILDAAENLSVQVHPDEDYAHRHPAAHMKSEAWIVLRHDDHAELYRGLDPDLPRHALRAAMESGSILQSLIRVPARVGDTHWLPSGICHALGAGITALEVQTPSDTTFRAWDWDRQDPTRELHYDQAEACTLTGEAQRLTELARLSQPRQSPVAGAQRLVETPFFSVDRIDACHADTIEIGPARAPRVLWLWSGEWSSAAPTRLPSSATIAVAACTRPFRLTCQAAGTVFISTAASRSGDSLRSPGFALERAR